jgi:imidazolonepropionase
MLQAGTTTFEAKSGYGLDRETELAQLRAIVDAGGGRHLARRACDPPEFADDGADAYVEFLLGEVLPEAARLAEAADVFLERGAFDADQARRYPQGVPRRRSCAAAARRPVHRGGRDPARD